jgi:hypothetical protein
MLNQWSLFDVGCSLLPPPGAGEGPGRGGSAETRLDFPTIPLTLPSPAPGGGKNLHHLRTGMKLLGRVAQPRPHPEKMIRPNLVFWMVGEASRWLLLEWPPPDPKRNGVHY